MKCKELTQTRAASTTAITLIITMALPGMATQP